jgi:hypothetical protein
MRVPADTPVKRVYRRLGRRHAFDLVLALVLATIAFWTGTTQIRDHGDGLYYQAEFAPAVRWACGGSFDGVRTPDAALEKFLADKAPSYRCDAGVADTAQRELDVFQTAERYLMLTAGLIWRVSGVSWEALAPLFGFLLALSTLVVFALFRLVLGPLLAAAGAAVVAISPTQLEYLPQLRDYSKAPFVLGMLLAAAIVATRPLRRRQLAVVCAAAGAVAGVGLGFRPDMLAVVPFFLLAVAFLTPGRLRETWRGRLAGVVAFLLVFALVGSPMLRLYGQGGNTAFFATHGLMEPFTHGLGLKQDLYQTGYVYDDGYNYETILAQADLVDHDAGEIGYQSPEMDDAAASLFRAHALNLPADFIVRVEASIVQTLKVGTLHFPRGDHPLGAVARGVADPVRNLPFGFLLPVLVAIAVMAFVRGKLAAFGILTVMYLGGLGSLQYDLRHVFYLEVLWWLALAVCGRAAFMVTRGLWRRRDQGFALERAWPPWACQAALRVSVAMGAIALLVTAPLTAARAYQSHHVRDLLATLDETPGTPLPLKREHVERGVLVRPDPAALWRGQGEIAHAYVRFTFDPRGCDSTALTPVLRYRWHHKVPGPLDFSTTFQVPFDPAQRRPMSAYRLVFRDGFEAFAGLELPPEQAECLTSATRLAPQRELPLLLQIRSFGLTEHPPLYQQFQWEG